jgi:3',5'-nucleoside bisphosphate phosphatase
MILEMHCHTSEYSACSHVNAVELITRICDMRFQGVVITDHHYQWSDEDLSIIKKKAGLPDKFLVLAGQEFKTSDFGDVLVYGLKESIPKQKLSMTELKTKYPHAAVVWAHPYRNNKIPLEKDLLNPLFDGIEILSSNYSIAEAVRALDDWHKYRFTAIAGTDTHALSYTGAYPTQFDHPVTSIEEVAAELKSGRCRPYIEEIPHEGTTNTKITEIKIAPGLKKDKIDLIVKEYENTEEWREGERTHYIISEIRKHGFTEGIYRTPKPLGKDEMKLSLIEEAVPGVTLYDKLQQCDDESVIKYLKMTAGCLAELHNLQLKVTPGDEYLPVEKERLDYYMSILYEEDHPHTERIQLISNEVFKLESEAIRKSDFLCQGHGDFHLKNIYVAEDETKGTEYLALIDFQSSYVMLPEFDAGTFISQYKNMFFDNPEFLRKFPAKLFLKEYSEKSINKHPEFFANVQLYKARANLSILYYLAKVGKGNSENFWTVLVETEKNLAQISLTRNRYK